MATAKTPTMTPIESEDYEERAAIIEYDGNLPRSTAEMIARVLIIKARTAHTLQF